MSEAVGERILVLKELGAPPCRGRAVPAPWRFSLGRMEDGETLHWIFHTTDTGALPRGYLESFRQRHDLLVDLNLPSQGSSVAMEEDSGELALVCPAIEGEPFPVYAARLASLPEGLIYHLVVALIQSLRTLVSAPRLFSNVDLEDFYVVARDGVLLSIRLCPAFCLLREELTMSDFQIAKKWTDLLAGIHGFVKQSRRVPLRKIDPAANKAFRPLLKEFESGKDQGLGERLLRVEQIFRSELDQSAEMAPRLRFPIRGDEMPTGLLSELFKRHLKGTCPDKLPPPQAGSDRALCFSPYLVEGSSGGGARDRLGYLLPPEHWFETSLIEPVNRRLSHPFLKVHHNGIRIRSVYCDENFTVLFGNSESGLPLPSLLSVFDGITHDDLLLLAGKLHRALAHFDSAGFDLSLSSPWQVELHIESGVDHPGWESLLNEEIRAWPPWEVKLRMERPTESFISTESETSWQYLAGRLSGKFFPVLVTWILGWKRFQCAARQGYLTGEPLSRDKRMDALFEAAGQHLEPTRPGQREKFLSLVREGIESVRNGKQSL